MRMAYRTAERVVWWCLFVALLAWAVYGSLVLAQTSCTTLSWTPPTQNTDGTPLTNLAGYVIYSGTASGGPYNLTTTQPNPSATSFVWCGLPTGMRYFAVTARNSANVESAFSNVASKLIVGAAPNPPTVPQPVTVGGQFFTLAITDDSMVPLPIGTVVAGRACDPTQQFAFNGASYMRVNRALVTPNPGQQVETAWAVCQ